MATRVGLSQLIGYGGVKSIAEQLSLLPGTVSAALRRGSPGHPAVRLALKIAKESGSIEAAQALATIPTVA